MNQTPLTITVNLSNIFIEDDQQIGDSLSETIRNSIIYEATNQVRKMVEASVNALIRQELSDKLDSVVPAMITARLESIHLSEQFKNQYGSATTLTDMIINKFQQTNFDRKLSEYVDAAAKKYSEEIKKNYDSRFAAGIVEGLNKHNLLNVDAAKVLLGQ